MNNLLIPDFALIVLIGASGSGKSTFGRSHFKATEIISSDFCRGLVSDNENDQTVSDDAFELLHYIAAKRLARMKLTVIDATNVSEAARKPLIQLARDYHALPVAIVLNLPDRLCFERNQARPDRTFGFHVVARHGRLLRQSLRNLKSEGFRRVFVLNSPEEIAAATIQREPLWNDKRQEHGPFDIIGDVHGCYDELLELLEKLGYQGDRETGRQGDKENFAEAIAPLLPLSLSAYLSHPAGRKLIFLGDLVDRGPKTPEVLRLVLRMVQAGQAICVPGNHDAKLLRALQGKNVQRSHGLAQTMEQLEAEPAEFRQQVMEFLDRLVSHYVLDDGKLVVAHAGMKQEMAGRASAAVREFALYGETTGETDEFGLPVRYNWAAEYRGEAMVVYGHTPVPEADWLNRTINIDTGCVFGGKLTALRYPEGELVAVSSRQTYAKSARPFLPSEVAIPSFTAQQQYDDVLDISDVLGKRYISTRLQPNIAIQEENAITALEAMSRFAVNPKWLIYLPPTMSPCETSTLPDLLEHPNEAFDYYLNNGVTQIICEEKHMGSRAVVLLCRSEEAARKHFGVAGEGQGVVYTRTGRPFFNDARLEQSFLARIDMAAQASGLWQELNSDWLLLDCELMPWSAKAQQLIQDQYAAVGAAAQTSLQAAVAALTQTVTRLPEANALLAQFQQRQSQVGHYIDAYRRYCWPVASINDLKLAPFHLLASENAVHSERDHLWHMQTLARLCAADPHLLLATRYQTVDVSDAASRANAVAWWESMTAQGGEGMVVKPLDFIVRGHQGLVQPAVKCRGREYLRIIYGPEYTSHLDALRRRGLRSKRMLALREFALGIESLERLVRREPLRRVHECVFGVLALESEPVDPRL